MVQVRQQHEVVVPPLYLEKGETPGSQNSWEHTPETLRRCLSRRVTSFPEGQPRKGICSDPSAKQGAFHPRCVCRNCTHKHWTAPALHRTAGNGVQLGQTPSALGSPFLNSLPSSQPPNTRYKPPGRGFGLGGCESSPHGTVCPPPIFIQCQERQQEQNQPVSPQRGSSACPPPTVRFTCLWWASSTLGSSKRPP